MNFATTDRHGGLAVTHGGRLKRTVGIAILMASAFCVFAAPVSANSGVSQGYSTKETDLTAGTLMGLSSDSKSAEPATSGHSYQLLGLVANKPLIALSDGSHQVQIVISGTSDSLVSTINGDVKIGDKLTASPIRGVAMKATEAGQIVGIAQTSLAKSDTRDVIITDKFGKQVTVKVGTVSLQVSISYYAGSQQGTLASILPPVLLNAANGIAGQQVSPLRVLIALMAMLFGFVIVGNMLQSAIRSSITAVGRNPLAKKALTRELLDVCLTALGILMLTSIVVYVIVKI